MLITKKINNNVAMAQDADGNELVVFGRGIGFRSTPYELEDTSIIQRVFHDVSPELLQTISSLSSEIIGASLDIVKVAEEMLDCKLNPNLYLTLADHLQFAAERVADGLVVENPLAAEIPSVYPAEYELGWRGVRIMADVTGIQLPEPEVYAIALHLVSAEADGGGFAGDIDSVMKVVHLIDDITQLLEQELSIQIDRTSHGYLRFTAHLRYLIKRLSSGDELTSENVELLKSVARDFPRSYVCSMRVVDYFQEQRGWKLTEAEQLYLMIYISRLESQFSKKGEAGA